MNRHSRTASVCVLLLVIGALTGCKASRSELTPDELFARASSAAAANDLTAALHLLEQSLAGGLERPSRAMWDPALESLRHHPPRRARVRELLDQYAHESTVRITTADEPGEPLTLRVTIIDEFTGMPVPGARVYVTHTDRDGRYQTDSDEWNPRLFGVALTDQRGRVEFHFQSAVSVR